MVRVARRLQPIICLVLACRGQPQHAAQDAAPAAKPPAATAPADAGHADHSGITITIGPAEAHGDALARRCTLAGAPIDDDCSDEGSSLALDRAGTLYVTAGKEVRRYRRTAGERCAYEPAGAAIPLPPDKPRAQSIDGTVYMRSGGPEWHLVAAGDAVYAYDFLGGLYRVDGGTSTPACVDVYGYRSVAVLDGKLLVARNGIEQLAPGPHCKASSAHIDDKLHATTLYAAGGHLYEGAFDLARYDGKSRAAVGGDTRVCYTKAIASCGEAACVLDSNCAQLVELDAAGKEQRVFDAGKLFDSRPYAFDGLLAEPDGSLLISTRQRDHSGDHAVCEAAIYELLAGALAR